jgi:Asp-tRNA(Asn)/Glu-tRNA(Gln) amidotransferase A subunit family amidase
VPTVGAFPLSPTLDSIGPLARSVAECAKADAVMAGEDFAPFEAPPLVGLRPRHRPGLSAGRKAAVTVHHDYDGASAVAEAPLETLSPGESSWRYRAAHPRNLQEAREYSPA